MYNEIQRKITSITLMAIMVAGGMTFAVPGMMPAAHAANANLFVSAENSQFNNYFAGPQVIEVVIRDSSIADTNEGKGEPDVTVNGAILRMVQANDGNWYGYFADKNNAMTAHNDADNNIDFGTMPENIVNDGDADLGVPLKGADGYSYGSTKVVRESKDVNANLGSAQLGQIGINADVWPFIQLYEFNPTGNVVVQYNRGGGVQSTTLTFDAVDDFATLKLDRDAYTLGAQVHATITDAWLNIDPTDEDSWTFDTATGAMFYQVYDESGNTEQALTNQMQVDGSALMCGDGCVLLLDPDKQGTGRDVITIQGNSDARLETSTEHGRLMVSHVDALSGIDIQPVTVTEQGPNSGVFGTYDESDTSVLKITDDARRGTSATLEYNESPVTVLVAFDFASLEFQPVDDTWNSGESIPVVLKDEDINKNTRVDEDITLSDPAYDIIPALRTGSPLTLGAAGGNLTVGAYYIEDAYMQTANASMTVDQISDVGRIQPFTPTDGNERIMVNTLIIDLNITGQTLLDAFHTNDDRFHGFDLLNYDVRSLPSVTDICLTYNNSNETLSLTDNSISYFDIGLLCMIHDVDADPDADNTNTSSLDQGLHMFKTLGNSSNVNCGGPDSGLITTDYGEFLTCMETSANGLTDNVGILIDVDRTPNGIFIPDSVYPIALDLFSFGFYDDGEQASERVANQIIRLELEESGDSTGVFEGSLEYTMLNQLNILDSDTYDFSTIADDPSFIVMEDLTDEDSPRVTYADLGADGVVTPVSDQQAAPSHSGVVSLNQDTYKVADTVVITLEDADLNVDSDLREIYTVVSTRGDMAYDAVGKEGLYLEDQKFNLGRLLDVTFDDAQWTTPLENTCLDPNDIALEDAADTGLGDTGFTLIETGTGTGVFTGDFQIPSVWCRDNATDSESTTGLDIEVNYVDFRDASGEIIEVGDSAGIRANTGSVSLDRTVYPVPFGDENDNSPSVFPLHATASPDGYLAKGDLSVHIRVNDPDFDVNPSGEDTIALLGAAPVNVSVLRGSETAHVGYAGNSSNPISEIAPDAGIFEYDLVIEYDDGPDQGCPSGFSDGCILQGDILQVEYADPTDASGDVNTVTDSATFDLRNGVLQSDKSVYIIGSDMILTLIEPDFDLDNDAAETYDLDLIEWDSDAATTSMGDRGIDPTTAAAFDPEPTAFRETGDSTGIFQVVIEIPEELAGDRLERGEEIVLEYTDWGPSGAKYVGDEDEDVNLTVFTSNFGATVELDQKVYTWTDKVYITIVAPDHNFDSDLVDEIGNTDRDPVKVSTRGSDLDNYKLVETGTDTGIFTGEVILTGFRHDADGDSTTGTDGYDVGHVAASGNNGGPTNGLLPAEDDDGLTVSFEFSENETVVGSALIRWNIGETQWLEASYPAIGTGIVRVIDPDMNLDPEAVDNFDVSVWSDSDSGGIDLTVTETNKATGIFEGTVFFTVTDVSSGHRLRVAEGDTVTAEYEDNTLPDPYTTADELDITATSLIGTVVPPLDRAPASNLRTVDAFGNSLDSVSVDQQVQISADLSNGQDREQSFAYLVQVQDANGVTVSLAWITGSLSAGQSFSPALSWIPTEAGAYTATAFVWESVDNPTALSPPVSTTVNVS